MDAPEITLHGFAYGEEVDAFGQRSLGYHLVAPAGGKSWRHEVETLARHLQATPYPDDWPAVDLFCSVLLGDKQRLIAVARYGLTDHSRDRRRGGLELIGVVTANRASVPDILAVYRWLQARRTSADDLHSLGGTTHLAAILSDSPCSPRTTPGITELPHGLWQDGAILFGATSPDEPDRHLHLLELSRTNRWQWLPLIGPDFPIQHYARQGPLVAWTSEVAETEPRESTTVVVVAEGGHRPPRIVAAFEMDEYTGRP
jgi:hypothetical protein